jgi:hypothetical protein
MSYYSSTSLDTIEDALARLFQELPNKEMLTALLQPVQVNNPRWSELEVCKYVLSRLEVAKRDRRGAEDEEIFQELLGRFSG